MLIELSVENIAIIDRAHITLGPGFTTITGETGAGKSLLVDSIDLALGGRADSGLVRSGASKAAVAMVVQVADNPEALAACTELGIEIEDGQLFIQREISAEGRSTCRIGGKLAPVGTLKQIGALLVDLHGQHDHQSLLDPATHLEYLDLWIGEEAARHRTAVAEKYSKAEDLRRRLQALRTNQRDREQRLDLLRFQWAEIESVKPQIGEFELLEAQISRLTHAEKLMEAAQSSLSALADQEGSAQESLSGSIKALEAAEQLDPSLSESLEQIKASLFALEDGLRTLRTYAEAIESNPQALNDAVDRLDLLRRLRKKYGDDEAAVLAFAEEVARQLSDFEDSETSEDEVAADLQTATGELSDAANKLTQLRTDKASRFSKLVADQLRDLAMEKALFETNIQPKEIDPSGADAIEFYFSANPGEPARPLARIASGGEISRVMLGVKVVLAGKAGVPTLIFDEVDTGLGGRAAAVVARKIEELAQHYQVIVISHLPQIAARGTTHYRIDKVTEGERVVTTLELLGPESRVAEVARMIAGEHVTESARTHAQALLTDNMSDQGLLLT